MVGFVYIYTIIIKTNKMKTLLKKILELLQECGKGASYAIKH